jgi:hypothetical protein
MSVVALVAGNIIEELGGSAKRDGGELLDVFLFLRYPDDL